MAVLVRGFSSVSAFALFLTAFPIAIVALKLFAVVLILTMVAVLAAMQMIGHLRYFMYVYLSPNERPGVVCLEQTMLFRIPIVGHRKVIVVKINLEHD